MSEDEMPDLTAVRQDKNSDGDVITYACEYLTSTAAGFNQLDEVVVPSYYDLIYPCGGTDSPADIRHKIALRLVERAATRWEIIPDGNTCSGMGVLVDDNALLAVSAEPADGFVSNLGCQSLTPGEGECCIVVKNEMTFTPSAPYTPTFWEFVAKELDSGELVREGETFRTAYIGSELDIVADGTDFADDGNDVVDDGNSLTPPVVAGAQREEPPAPADKGKFSIGGALVFTALVLALIGVAALFWRRRSQDRRVKDIDLALSVADPAGDTDGGEPSFQVSVVRDEDAPDVSRDVSQLDQSTWSYAADDEDESEEDEEKQSRVSSGFDLGDGLRKNVLGAYGVSQQDFTSSPSRYGPTTIEVVPPYPMEETSDSEADSWAQTDGTVGSLEERLEEITVEI